MKNHTPQQQLQKAQADAEAQARYLAGHLNSKEFTARVGDCAITVNGLGVVTNVATPNEQTSLQLQSAWDQCVAEARAYAMKVSNGGQFPTPAYKPQ